MLMPAVGACESYDSVPCLVMPGREPDHAASLKSYHCGPRPLCGYMDCDLQLNLCLTMLTRCTLRQLSLYGHLLRKALRNEKANGQCMPLNRTSFI